MADLYHTIIIARDGRISSGDSIEGEKCYQERANTEREREGERKRKVRQ